MEERGGELKQSFSKIKEFDNDLKSRTERTTVIGKPKKGNKVKVSSKTHSKNVSKSAKVFQNYWTSMR